MLDKKETFCDKLFVFTSKFFKSIFWIVLAVECISLLFVIYWLVVTSFKNGTVDYLKNPFGFSSNPTFKNFAYVFQNLHVDIVKSNGLKIRYGIFEMLGNSFIWSLGTSSIIVFFTTVMAYVLAKYHFFGSKFLYSLGIVIMVIPIIGALPSSMVIKKAMGVYNNMFLMMITTPVGCFFGTHFLVLYAMFKGISSDYAEAASIDGANHWRILFQIMMPMALPTMMVIFVLLFLEQWNNYSTFLIWLPSYPNLALGLYNFQQNMTSLGASVPEVMTGFLIGAIPVVILFALSQKVIMNKFTVGGLKG